MEYLLEIRPNDTTIDFNKYRDKFVPTFINLYPDFQAAKNYQELANSIVITYENEYPVIDIQVLEILVEKFIKFKSSIKL
jgi:hypothetical protein